MGEKVSQTQIRAITEPMEGHTMVLYAEGRSYVTHCSCGALFTETPVEMLSAQIR